MLCFDDTRIDGSIQPVIVHFTRYHKTGGLAIQLLCDDGTGAPWAMATTCLPGAPLEPNQVLIRNVSENEGMTDMLVANGVIKPDPLFEVKTVHHAFWAHELSDEAWNAALSHFPSLRHGAARATPKEPA